GRASKSIRRDVATATRPTLSAQTRNVPRASAPARRPAEHGPTAASFDAHAEKKSFFFWRRKPCGSATLRPSTGYLICFFFFFFFFFLQGIFLRLRNWFEKTLSAFSFRWFLSRLWGRAAAAEPVFSSTCVPRVPRHILFFFFFFFFPGHAGVLWREKKGSPFFSKLIVARRALGDCPRGVWLVSGNTFKLISCSGTTLRPRAAPSSDQRSR
ncbi:MAG: hypothetical protein BJ554DRAFT_2171, partial [Olpidium bornovanus]